MVLIPAGQEPQNLPSVRRQSQVVLPVGDYVSAGLDRVQPDACFPHMGMGDRAACSWVWMRREIPHNWYCDLRRPYIGFLTRDEAHLLYNSALQFRGKRALEIGCWMGWSACHLGLAGLRLDVIDPVLADPEFYADIAASLGSAGLSDSVRLHLGCSPALVQQLATEIAEPWSFIFIDGDHEFPAPLMDAIACEPFAAADAMIMFHDLNSPNVTQGLDYLKLRGWNTLIYQTMQIVGVAWRGNVSPVTHYPDPNVEWQLPEHLKHYSVSHWAASDDRIISGEVDEAILSDLCQRFSLRERNLILFPNWQMSEEELSSQFVDIFRKLANRSHPSPTTLLVATSNGCLEAIDELLSGLAMQLLFNEDVDIEPLEIALIDQLTQTEWQVLRSQIQGRIGTHFDNLQAIAATGSIALPVIRCL
jgi:hypothetical protein